MYSTFKASEAEAFVTLTINLVLIRLVVSWQSDMTSQVKNDMDSVAVNVTRT
jgi:hypothetical protein